MIGAAMGAVTLKAEQTLLRFDRLGNCLGEEALNEVGADGRNDSENTMAAGIIRAHNHSGSREKLELIFDALVSPDNNYVNILQTARASGLREFPVPYVLSNCHNTLCAVGGTVNEDDHRFGADSAKRYGGIFLPPYRGILHQYMREQMAGCGMMILGSDSHTRYGALGTMGIGEGGGELVKQLLGRTYDLAMPPVIAVRLNGRLKAGIGPMDVALSIIGKTFQNGFTKNKILEFVGNGIAALSVEMRMGIDVMMTESGALSSIWMTDEKVRDYLELHGRGEAYQKLMPGEQALYDGIIDVDLSEVESMMALPFHPSNVVSIHAFQEEAERYLKEIEKEGNRIKAGRGKPFSILHHLRDGAFYPDQALISGCAGGLFENIADVADILEGAMIQPGNTGLGINPASQPVNVALMQSGVAARLITAGATIRPCICGPCFGVTDVPQDNGLSIRHVTRNYPNRDGAKPGQGQMAADILMDARSIAATVRNGGRLTAATDLSVNYTHPAYIYESSIYQKQVYQGFGKADPQASLHLGPNIADWPEIQGLREHVLLQVAGAYEGSITTDDLIPSGEPSSYRSNPEKLAGFTMMSRDPEYVPTAKIIRQEAEEFSRTGAFRDAELKQELQNLCRNRGFEPKQFSFGSVMVSDELGDGSSREQAASCQKVLGGLGNLAHAYATKRYRSNLINWGILPLVTELPLGLKKGDLLLIEGIREQLNDKDGEISVEIIKGTKAGKKLSCSIGKLTEEEKQILLAGCLINHYRSGTLKNVTEM